MIQCFAETCPGLEPKQQDPGVHHPHHHQQSPRVGRQRSHKGGAGGEGSSSPLSLKRFELIEINIYFMITLQEEDNSLHLVQGCYGVWDSKRGFSRLTNFFMEPVGFISSKRFILKGNLWDLVFVSGEKARIFVPEGQQSQPQKFKYFFDAQYVDIR